MLRFISFFILLLMPCHASLRLLMVLLHAYAMPPLFVIIYCCRYAFSPAHESLYAPYAADCCVSLPRTIFACRCCCHADLLTLRQRRQIFSFADILLLLSAVSLSPRVSIKSFFYATAAAAATLFFVADAAMMPGYADVADAAAAFLSPPSLPPCRFFIFRHAAAAAIAAISPRRFRADVAAFAFRYFAGMMLYDTPLPHAPCLR